MSGLGRMQVNLKSIFIYISAIAVSCDCSGVVNSDLIVRIGNCSI